MLKQIAVFVACIVTLCACAEPSKSAPVIALTPQVQAALDTLHTELQATQDAIAVLQRRASALQALAAAVTAAAAAAADDDGTAQPDTANVTIQQIVAAAQAHTLAAAAPRQEQAVPLATPLRVEPGVAARPASLGRFGQYEWDDVLLPRARNVTVEHAMAIAAFGLRGRASFMSSRATSAGSVPALFFHVVAARPGQLHIVDDIGRSILTAPSVCDLSGDDTRAHLTVLTSTAQPLIALGTSKGCMAMWQLASWQGTSMLTGNRTDVLHGEPRSESPCGMVSTRPGLQYSQQPPRGAEGITMQLACRTHVPQVADQGTALLNKFRGVAKVGEQGEVLPEQSSNAPAPWSITAVTSAAAGRFHLAVFGTEHGVVCAVATDGMVWCYHATARLPGGAAGISALASGTTQVAFAAGHHVGQLRTVSGSSSLQSCHSPASDVTALTFDAKHPGMLWAGLADGALALFELHHKRNVQAQARCNLVHRMGQPGSSGRPVQSVVALPGYVVTAVGPSLAAWNTTFAPRIRPALVAGAVLPVQDEADAVRTAACSAGLLKTRSRTSAQLSCFVGAGSLWIWDSLLPQPTRSETDGSWFRLPVLGTAVLGVLLWQFRKAWGGKSSSTSKNRRLSRSGDADMAAMMAAMAKSKSGGQFNPAGDAAVERELRQAMDRIKEQQAQWAAAGPPRPASDWTNRRDEYDWSEQPHDQFADEFVDDFDGDRSTWGPAAPGWEALHKYADDVGATLVPGDEDSD